MSVPIRREARAGRWLVAHVEAAGLALWILGFTRLHVAAGQGVADVATANAVSLQSLERALRLDIELPVNRWLTEHPAQIQPAVYWYRLYYAVILGVLVWLFVRRTDAYARARRALVAMTALALPVFWALPMAPPRFALPGVVDSIAGHDPVWGAATRDLDSGRNLFSAMPSLHVGLSMWCAYAVWSALRGTHPRLALLPWLYPLVMAAVVIATGNHYVLDIAGSAVLLIAAVAVASLSGHLMRRVRRRAGG